MEQKDYLEYINEQNRKALILLAGCVCKGYWEQQEILSELEELEVVCSKKVILQ